MWAGALVARPEITALEVGGTIAVSDAAPSVVVVVAGVVAVAIAVPRVVAAIVVTIIVTRVVALASIVVAVVARESSSWRPLLPPIVGRADAGLVIVVVATAVVVATTIGKVAAGAA